MDDAASVGSVQGPPERILARTPRIGNSLGMI